MIAAGIVCIGLAGVPAAAQAEEQVAVVDGGTTPSIRVITGAGGAPGSPGTETLAPRPITGLPAGEEIAGTDVRPATTDLYAVTITTAAPRIARLYTLDVYTGALVRVGTTDVPLRSNATTLGVDFNPVTDQLRVVSDANDNVRLDPDTGAIAGTDTDLAFASGDPFQFESPRVIGAAYSNNVPEATSTRLFDTRINGAGTVLTYVEQGLLSSGQSPDTGQLHSPGTTGTQITNDNGTRAPLDRKGENDVSRAGQEYYTIRTTPDAANYLLLNTTPGSSFFSAFAALDPGVDQDQEIAVLPVYLGVDDAIVDESAGTATVTVRRLLGGSTGAVSVDYATSDVDATAGSDYTATSGTLTLPSGADTATFTVPVTDDALLEGTEAVRVSLSSPAGGARIQDPEGILRIIDDEANTFAVTSRTVSEAAGTVDVTVRRYGTRETAASVDFATGGGTATAGEDYTPQTGTLTFPAGGPATRTITVPVIDDTAVEPDETFDVTLSNATGGATADTGKGVVTILEDDVPPASMSIGSRTVDEAAGTVTLTVRRTGDLSGTATVGYDTADGSAIAPGDYATTGGTLTFAPGVEAQTFTVPIADDTVVEQAETFRATLSTPTGNAVVSPFDGTATVTILDDDEAPATLVPTGAAVSEGAGTATVTVRRVGSTGGAVTVRAATADGSATAGSDYGTTSEVLTFAPGQTVRTLTVPITDDATPEGEESFTVGLGSVTGNAVVAADPAVVRLMDDDKPSDVGGSSPDPVPAVSIQSPASGARLSPGFPVTVRLSADRATLVRVTLGSREVCVTTTSSCTFRLTGVDVANARTLTATAVGQDGRQSTSSRQVQVPRFGPAHVSRGVRRVGAGRFVVFGRLVLPVGVAEAEGCAGSVSVTLSTGSGKPLRRRVPVGKDCRYTSDTLTVAHGQLARAVGHRLRFYVRYNGSAVLHSYLTPTLGTSAR